VLVGLTKRLAIGQRAQLQASNYFVGAPKRSTGGFHFEISEHRALRSRRWLVREGILQPASSQRSRPKAALAVSVVESPAAQERSRT
jgi:hypothetical protein